MFCFPFCLHSHYLSSTWAQHNRVCWLQSFQQEPPNVLVFRGLRVRMGMHSGVTLASDLMFNTTRGMMAYSGLPLILAKAVSDAAVGGMVRERASESVPLELAIHSLRTEQDCLVCARTLLLY